MEIFGIATSELYLDFDRKIQRAKLGQALHEGPIRLNQWDRLHLQAALD